MMVMGGACLATPSLGQAKAGTKPIRKTAEIVRRDRLTLASARDAIRDLAPDLIRRAFPAPSQHQTCLEAAKVFGTSPDSVQRLIDGSTQRADILALALAAQIYERRTDKAHPIKLHILKLMGAA